MEHRLQAGGLLLLAFVAAACTGCASHVGKRIVEAPNLEGRDITGPKQLEGFWTHGVEKHIFADRIEINSSVDDALLTAFVLPAGDYVHEYSFEMSEAGSGKLNFHVWFNDGPNLPATGSVLLLHGWQSSYRQMFFHSLALADHGWDVYLADLRGHGQSGGDYVGFGVLETADIRQLVQVIRRDPTFTGPLAVVGASLGGAVALMAAADEPAIDAVAAIAPFAEFKQMLPGGVKIMARGYMRPWLGEKKLKKALDIAERVAKVDLDLAAPILTAGEVTQPVLLVHGRPDRFVPFDHSERLHAALPNSRLVAIDDRGHIPLMLDRDAVLRPLLPWLDELRGSNTEPDERAGRQGIRNADSAR